MDWTVFYNNLKIESNFTSRGIGRILFQISWINQTLAAHFINSTIHYFINVYISIGSGPFEGEKGVFGKLRGASLSMSLATEFLKMYEPKFGKMLKDLHNQ